MDYDAYDILGIYNQRANTTANGIMASGMNMSVVLRNKKIYCFFDSRLPAYAKLLSDIFSSRSKAFGAGSYVELSC